MQLFNSDHGLGYHTADQGDDNNKLGICGGKVDEDGDEGSSDKVPESTMKVNGRSIAVDSCKTYDLFRNRGENDGADFKICKTLV